MRCPGSVAKPCRQYRSVRVSRDGENDKVESQAQKRPCNRCGSESWAGSVTHEERSAGDRDKDCVSAREYAREYRTESGGIYTTTKPSPSD